MQLEKKESLDKTVKIELLQKHLVLEEKPTYENAKAVPDTLRDVNFDLRDKVLLSMATMHSILGQTDEEEKIIRTLVDKRKDRSNLSHFYSLSVLLEKTDRFAEAVEIETRVRDWLDGRLGMDSPQAIGSRRIIARATWKQG